MRIVSALIGALALGSAASGQEPPAPAPAPLSPRQDSISPATSTARELSRADLEAWLDGLLPYALQQNDVAGAVIAVVKDGQVLLQKGYGYADVEKRIPVDPERTLFRTGSVGKLFTWTAVMQQVEQGRLDLDRDINDYLDFKIPLAFGKPITLRHLMTHRSGLAEPLKRLIVEDPKLLEPLDVYLKAHVPAQIFPPGEVPAYSNYGAALAGYIVQRVSGEPFEAYCEQHILLPLGMQRSTFRQPLPQKFAANMAKGYRKASGAPFYFELGSPRPAGTMSSTGADMAQFMIAHLRARESEGGILRRETTHLMHESITRSIPPLDGMTLGFFQSSDRNGRRVIGHGGDTQVFHSDLQLLIDDGVGLFMSFNSSGKGDIRVGLFEQFLDRYFPAPAAPRVEPTATALQHTRLIAGAGPYRSTRRAESSFFELVGLLGQEKIETKEDGTLVVPGITGLNDEPKVWREIGPYLWREVGGGNERLAARVTDGKVQFIGSDSLAGVQLMQPVPPLRSATWNVPLLIGSVGVFVLTISLWPVTALVRRHYGAKPTMPAREALAQRLVWIVALINLTFLGGWALVVRAVDSDLAVFDGRLDPWIVLLHVTGVLVLVGAAIALWNAWLAWRGTRGAAAKLWSAIVALACISSVWFMFAFSLIGVSLSY